MDDALAFDRTVKIMNVCGGHERSITHAGLRGALPKWVELVPGPGCPVCVCPEEDVYQAIQLALRNKVILVAYGDMLRVPVNVKKGEVRSLAEAQAAGADVRPIASPLDARRIALWARKSLVRAPHRVIAGAGRRSLRARAHARRRIRLGQ